MGWGLERTMYGFVCITIALGLATGCILNEVRFLLPSSPPPPPSFDAFALEKKGSLKN